MALCNSRELLEAACANQFACIADDSKSVNAVAIELLRTATGNTDNAETLLAQATAVGFLTVAQSNQNFWAVANQLICNTLNP